MGDDMAGRTDDGVHGADAFAQALVAELPRLVRLATRLVRDADQAEDCAQETIVGAWRRREMHAPIGRLSAAWRGRWVWARALISPAPRTFGMRCAASGRRARG